MTNPHAALLQSMRDHANNIRRSILKDGPYAKLFDRAAEEIKRLQMRLKRHEPVSLYNGHDIDWWKTEAERLREELSAAYDWLGPPEHAGRALREYLDRIKPLCTVDKKTVVAPSAADHFSADPSQEGPGKAAGGASLEPNPHLYGQDREWKWTQACQCPRCKQVTDQFRFDQQMRDAEKSSEGHRDPELARENVVAPYQDVPLMERSERAIKKPLTPNDCPKCVGLGYCRCEIASNE